MEYADEDYAYTYYQYESDWETSFSTYAEAHRAREYYRKATGSPTAGGAIFEYQRREIKE